MRPSIESVRLLKRQGNHDAARAACDELLAAGGLSSRDLIVLSDQCKSGGKLGDWEYYRRAAYASEMSQLGLKDQDHADAVEFCLASDGAGEPLAQPPASYVRATFDRYSSSFDQRLVGELDYRGPEEVYRVVASHLGGGFSSLRVLDVGCGTGLAGPLFRPHAIQLDGIDLSTSMIQCSADRGVYDELRVGDLTESLGGIPDRYDLVLAVDLFIYIGDLSDALPAIRSVLAPNGILAASFEKGANGYQLCDNRRFQHALDYVREESLAAGLSMIHVDPISLRNERGKPVDFSIALFSASKLF